MPGCRNVAVVVPWRGGCPHRERALSWVVTKYQTTHPTWQVVLGEHTADQWCKAEAVTAGLALTDADRLVIADADCWVDNLADAVNSSAPWTVPHLMVHRLDEQSTEQMYRTGVPGPGRTERPYRGHVGGGVVVIDRETYDAVPLDPRFTGWGQEDDSWSVALHTLVGPPHRGDADLVHLWHPPQKRMNRINGSRAGVALARRYRAVRNDPEAMRTLIDQGKRTLTEARA